jgi:replication factor C subunit 3/5
LIEKYTRNTRFCLICNYVSKIIPALQSRCTRFRFAPLPAEVALARLRHVADAEAVPATEEGLLAIQILSGGDMRRAEHPAKHCHGIGTSGRGGGVRLYRPPAPC